MAKSKAKSKKDPFGALTTVDLPEGSRVADLTARLAADHPKLAKHLPRLAVAVDGEGNVYVADYENHRIQMFTNDGTFVDSENGLSQSSFTARRYSR